MYVFILTIDKRLQSIHCIQHTYFELELTNEAGTSSRWETKTGIQQHSNVWIIKVMHANRECKVLSKHFVIYLRDKNFSTPIVYIWGVHLRCLENGCEFSKVQKFSFNFACDTSGSAFRLIFMTVNVDK